MNKANYIIYAVCIIIAILNVVFNKNKKMSFIIALVAIVAAVILNKFI